jgi:hypothetical protein
MKLLIAGLIVFGCLGVAQAEETLTEKAAVAANSVKRAGKKGLNRTKEALCGKLTGDSKVECLAKQAKNRVEEGVDAVSDKGSEIKNSVDTDK